MRHSLLPVLALLLVVSCVRVPSRFAQAQPRDVLYSGMVGRWRGAPTPAASGVAGPIAASSAAELVVVPAPDRDGLELRYREPAGSSTVERSIGHWRFGRTLDVAEWGGVNDERALSYRVVQRTGGNNGTPLSLVLEAAASEADQPALIRQRIDVGTGSLSLRTEVQVAGGDFMLRRSYVFRRAE